MKLKMGSKRYTLVIIPDANSSVRRFEVPKLIPYIAGAGLMTLVSITLVLYVGHARNASVANKLQTQIVSRDAEYTSTVQEKNQTIEQLQNQVIQLSQQTAEMKAKIDDIRKQEDEIRTITGSGQVKISSADVAPAAGAMGGSSTQASNGEVQVLVEQTKSQLSDLDKSVDELKDSIADTKEKAIEAQQKLRITPNIWPVDSRTITSGFGLRQDPFTMRPSFHSGYDISAPRDTPVHVTADGVVTTTGSDSSHGNNIVVTHSKGLQTWYMHLNKMLVQKGDRVEKGQVIGLVGTTGRSTGYHLHYEVLKNGVSSDPKPYLP
ncbi:M23 family metallopeptidase [Paenibacillus rigui]|nr:M23 family metallopeptidase [Paenibacillus rigui]